MEKRKRGDDGGSNGGRKANPRDDGAVKGPVPADEEVEEFFAILKRIQVAVKYFQDRRCAESEMNAAAPPRWSPTFEREDFDGVRKEGERSQGNRSVGLDLNSDPGCDVSDRGD
ncbi:uncharacterized protein LOC131025050 [Salvia miltiorrhiza]|uniref:uncharacterized protein LOC131025050 n=1 Tax=Salvia miltiorrhiza TaxID=226208 RepID=UPI0025AB870F|nr:uncharacterized protein LOC131025050 [Salvia miltiorrhiza]